MMKIVIAVLLVGLAGCGTFPYQTTATAQNAADLSALEARVDALEQIAHPRKIK